VSAFFKCLVLSGQSAPGPASAVPDFWGLKELDAFLLVVDGVPSGGSFNPALTMLDMNDIERIEVVRGPAPVLSWVPPRLPSVSDDTTLRLLDLYRHTDPALARVLEERIGLSAIARAQDRPQRADVGLMSGCEHQRRLGPQPLGQLLLEPDVHVGGAV